MQRNLIFFVLLEYLLFNTSALAEDFNFYALPAMTNAKVYDVWTPLIAKVNETAKLDIRLVVPQNIMDFEAALNAQTPDFAFVSPHQVLIGKKLKAYEPILLEGGEPIIGMILVRKDSPIQKLEELDKKLVGFPMPNSLCGSVLLRRMLIEKHKTNIESKFLMHHSNVYRSVLRGEVIAGGGINKTFHQEPSEIQNELRVLYQTPPFASFAIIVHNRVSKEIKDKVVKYFQELPNFPELTGFMKSAMMTKPVPTDYNKDFKPIEDMHLERFLIKDPKLDPKKMHEH